ncbi:hypothetical protein BLL37_23930 [Pseudomonas azotoformans]|uniref:Uncharacterized protein n=1 Tax=Pseudomonas azotoformans TaxID=47878 RepID=A0A1V2J9W0_PSEAZ|nr:hypothetical protein [Pseudomonas azotoformans]OIN50611.1 hypothetical protein BFL39_06320 [Pseudomonas azotoformans]ONH42223.1 hypothetical protein BLL37_23930 [Pseudomonas azotoformans]SDN35304.1 hypothetical protein SAMN04489799_1747 [Pseudomonas azotoformans]
MSAIQFQPLSASTVASQSQVGALQNTVNTAPTAREKIEVLVRASDVDKTMNIAFRIAEAMGMAFPNAEVGSPEHANFQTPENGYPIKFDFRPDGPDGTYTSELQQKINRFKEQFAQTLRHEGVENAH